MDRPVKFLVCGYSLSDKRKLRQIVIEETDLKVSMHKLRPKELAFTQYAFALMHPNSVFNNHKIPGRIGEAELNDCSNYNIKIIYLFSNYNREKPVNLNGQAEYYKDKIDLVIMPESFQGEAVGAREEIKRFIKRHVQKLK